MILDRMSQDISGFRQKVIFGLFIFLILIPSFFGGEWSKWLQAAILVATSLLAFYLIILISQGTSTLANAKSNILRSPVLYLVIFLLVVAISSFFSVNHYDSFSLLFLLVSYIVVFFGAKYFFREWKLVNAISHVIFFVGVVAALISLVMFAFQSVNRGSGFLFNANALGSYLLFSLPLGIMILAKYSQQKIRYLYYICAAIIFIAFVLTYSYTSWVSFIFPGIMMLIFFRRAIFTKRIMAVCAGLLLCVLVVLTVFRYSQSHSWSKAVKIYDTIDRQHLISSFDQRFSFNYSSIKMLLDKPLTGFGYNTYQTVYARYALSLLEQPRYAHNYYLQTAAETGAIGGVAFVAFVILLSIRAYKKVTAQIDQSKKYIYFGLWLGVSGSAVHAFFDFGWQFPAVFILFWLCGGILLGKDPECNESGNSMTAETQIKGANSFIRIAKILLTFLAVAFLFRGCTLFLGVNYFQKGERAAVDGDFGSSYGYYAQGWRFDPDPTSLVNEISSLGIGYQVLAPEQQSELKKKLVTVLRQNPQYYAGHYYLGQLYFTDKDEAAALKEYQEAILYNPVFRPDFYYSAALVMYDNKEYENSKKTVLTILNKYGNLEASSNPNLPTQLAFLHLLLGQNYQTIGNVEKARAEYQHALRLKPFFPLVEEKLKELP